MKAKQAILRTMFLFTFILSVSSIASSLAQEEKRTALISEVKGKVKVSINGQAWAPAKQGMLLTQDDAISTMPNSNAVLKLDGDDESATVEIKPNSQLKLLQFSGQEQADSRTTLLDLSLGEILIKAKKLRSDKSRFEVKTPTSVVGVRGTTFIVAVEAME